MIELNKLVPTVVLQNLSLTEIDYLKETFERFDGYPDLEQIWALMDEPWVELGCDPLNVDDRVSAYYEHPVWMLNGLFIEQHSESLKYRQQFAKWVVEQSPKRVADFGGGFGGLARFVGEALPDTQVEVIDPYPHPAAIALAADTPNVSFVPELSGHYDILIATDVFEHVSDPIKLAAETASHLPVGGQYLIANCFAPVILCHLPQLFHFNISWNGVMQAMGLVPTKKVAYGRSYRRQGKLDMIAARKKADCGRKLFPWVSWLPRGQRTAGRIIMRIFCN